MNNAIIINNKYINIDAISTVTKSPDGNTIKLEFNNGKFIHLEGENARIIWKRLVLNAKHKIPTDPKKDEE